MGRSSPRQECHRLALYLPRVQPFFKLKPLSYCCMPWVILQSTEMVAFVTFIQLFWSEDLPISLLSQRWKSPHHTPCLSLVVLLKIPRNRVVCTCHVLFPMFTKLLGQCSAIRGTFKSSHRSMSQLEFLIGDRFNTYWLHTAFPSLIYS